MCREAVFTITKGECISVYKFTNGERAAVKSLIAALSIKRIPEPDIIKAIFDQTGKTISDRYYYALKAQIKKESYHWYKTMREGQYEYIHEFKERIEEILDLQRRHHEILNSDREPTTVKQSSLVELHKLNITLSSYFDVAPDIINGTTLSPPSETKTTVPSPTPEIIV